MALPTSPTHKGLKPGIKLVLILLVFGLAYLGYSILKSNGTFTSTKNTATTEASSTKITDEHIFKVGVVTWGGYAGGQYFNEGFKASTSSRYYTEYGIQVEFVKLDDFVTSRDAWKSGDVDLLWVTADAFPTESTSLMRYSPKFIFQADWSRKGDAIVAVKGINNVNDLRGKKIAVAFGTPSHTFLIHVLEAAGIGYSEVQIIQAPSAIDAATYFKAGQVEAAVVWSPDDRDCVTNVKGSKVLTNTGQAKYVIADGFFVKEKFLNEHFDGLVRLVEGWLRGAAEINSNPEAKDKAAQILADGLDQPKDFCLDAINNVRLVTLGDNINFMGMNPSYTGVTGEQLYTKMSKKYNKINLAPFNTPSWSQVSSTKILSQINLTDPNQDAEGSKTFSNISNETITNDKVYSKKPITITFASGSSTLDANAKYIIDSEFGDVARSFKDMYIRVSGNTDNTGVYDVNKTISNLRAQAVADYLIQKYGFNRNRFISVGNGPDNPVASNATAEGRAQNRRTDLELINE